jgi:uncharacterized protein
MQYRTFPLIDDVKVSALGFGCMRLPVLGGDAAAIDSAALDAMLAAAESVGINYLDTAYVYHKGASESALGAALERSGKRDKFFLATKSPVWLAKDKDDWDRFLDEQLEKLRTDHIDFYLLHALGRERWARINELGALPALERAKAAGKIRHLGFSFHDSPASFKEIIDGYDAWEFCQVQYNYVDRDFQAGEEGLAYAAEREIGAIVMEPLRGGALAAPPVAVKAAFAKYPTPRLPYEWALRFVLDRQEVSLVLSGMGSANQILENAAIAASARANTMTNAERDVIDEARGLFKEREKVGCTTCGYCQPCPAGVNIPEVFSLYNAGAMFGSMKDRGGWYKASLVADGHDAGSCVRCGDCLPKCPQGIAIPDRLEEAHSALTVTE